jgi:succinate-semialdehyde dehydrogenase/glutarate-semialdehyde dehydrogenase
MLSVNPYNLEKIASYSSLNGAEIEEKINVAQHVFGSWKKVDFETKKDLLLKLGEILLIKKNQLALLITNEMGKPITQSLAEIEKCAWVCNYYAENSAQILQDQPIKTEATNSFIRYNPMGIVLAIMPWNFPFWQYFRFIAPNVMAGNVGILKHASNVCGCALAIEELFLEAGFPKGISQTLIIESCKVKQVLEHPYVKAATLTGSEAAGASVASIAGANIKKTVLELGGANAVIVLNDADLNSIIDTCVMARFQNNGQSCIAGKRFLIQNEIYDEFLKLFTQKVASLKKGNPLDNSTQISCMATLKLAEELENQLNESIKMGATLHLGGSRNNTHFEPTILTNVTPNMPVFFQETFGPLAAISKFSTIDEAIELSNNSVFGLGISIFTKNISVAEKMINELDEGAVFINEMVKSDPRLPFGGIKKSGYGRELANDGLLEFVNKKTVYIK